MNGCLVGNVMLIKTDDKIQQTFIFSTVNLMYFVNSCLVLLADPKWLQKYVQNWYSFSCTIIKCVAINPFAAAVSTSGACHKLPACHVP